MDRVRLTVYERGIISILRSARRSLSTKEVADYGSMNWATAKKYLMKLHRKKIVKRSLKDRTYYWKV